MNVCGAIFIGDGEKYAYGEQVRVSPIFVIGCILTLMIMAVAVYKASGKRRAKHLGDSRKHKRRNKRI